MSDQETDMDRLKSKCHQLMEHFDSVRIFATRKLEDDQTVHCSWGEGNWFASYGQIVEWTIQKEEETRIKVRKADE